MRNSWMLGVFFLLTYIGAAMYFITYSNESFSSIVAGLLKALVWPVYLIFHLLVLLHA